VRKFNRGGVYKVKPGCLVCGAGPEYIVPANKVSKPVNADPAQKPITIQVTVDVKPMKYHRWCF